MSRVSVETWAPGVAGVLMTGDGRNPLDLDLVTELADALEGIDADPTWRAGVVASGDRHFCAGATAKFGAGDAAWSTPDLYRVVPRLFAVDLPIVVALNGAAIGGGAGLAMIGDWRQMAADARVQINFSRLGYTPGFGLTRVLPDLVGSHRAGDLLESGRSVDAGEALAIGLCDAVSDPELLMADATARASVMAEAAPLAARALKARRLAGLRAELPGVLDDELRLQERLKQTADYAEGMAAMRERRAPRFEGR